ncbi:MAG: hypothetical protein LBM98_00515 [Oscillospiraceae bacterium]|nr:hypothetical protein [Oscillospiraceae bacterium]
MKIGNPGEARCVAPTGCRLWRGRTRGHVRARRGETTPPPTAAPLPRGEFTGATPAACGRHPLLRKGAFFGLDGYVAHGAGNHPAAYGGTPPRRGIYGGNPRRLWAAPPSPEGGYFGLDEGCGIARG